MTKKEKYESLYKALIKKTRDDDTEYICFSDDAPEELRDIFIDHNSIIDVDYDIFRTACVLLSENPDKPEDELHELADDCASVYTYDRLEYLSVMNQQEISDIMREYETEDIATACAIWYEQQVASAIQTIYSEYINATE